MSCHLLSNIQQREREKEMVRNKLSAEKLNMTPHQTCLKIRWRSGSGPGCETIFLLISVHLVVTGCL